MALADALPVELAMVVVVVDAVVFTGAVEGDVLLAAAVSVLLALEVLVGVVFPALELLDDVVDAEKLAVEGVVSVLAVDLVEALEAVEAVDLVEGPGVEDAVESVVAVDLVDALAEDTGEVVVDCEDEIVVVLAEVTVAIVDAVVDAELTVLMVEPDASAVVCCTSIPVTRIGPPTYGFASDS